MSEEPRGLYYENLHLGAVFRSRRRVIGAEDIAAFADLTGDHNPLHVSAEFAATGPFGRVIAHGLYGLALIIGMFEEAEIFHGTAVAFLGISSWTFSKPVFAGDEVTATMTIAGKRVSRSDATRGIVTRRLELSNQDREVVQHGEATLLVRLRPVDVIA